MRIPAELERNLRFRSRAVPGRLWWAVIGSIRNLLLQAAGVSLLSSFSTAVAALIGMRILKAQAGDDRLIWLAFAFFGANCVAAVCAYANTRQRSWVGLGVESFFASLLSSKIARLSSRGASRFSKGNLKVLITSDIQQIGEFFDNSVRNFIPSVAATLVALPLLSHFAGTAGVIGALIMFAVLPFSIAMNSVAIRWYDRVQARTDILTSLAGEWVKNIRLIRFLSWQRKMQTEIARSVAELTKLQVAHHFVVCILFGMTTSWWMLAVAGVVAISRWLRIPLDPAAFFGSIWLITLLHGYLSHLPNTMRLFGTASASLRRIRELLETEEQADLLDPDSVEGWNDSRIVELVLEGVEYSFNEGAPVLRNLNLSIGLNEKVAILGEVGAGKTTLLRLLSGELRPTRGRIRVVFEDGVSRDFWERGCYRRTRDRIAYVPQEPFVSNDSILSNIALDEAEESDGMKAAYEAEFLADLERLPGGIRQEIGENGVNLSGGQRQRLNLARAYFSRREFFVLDDTLSAVDVRTERKMMDHLMASSSGFALATHRVGELSRVERILVMKEGRLVEDGRPAELMADPGSQFMKVLRAYEQEEETVNG